MAKKLRFYYGPYNKDIEYSKYMQIEDSRDAQNYENRFEFENQRNWSKFSNLILQCDKELFYNVIDHFRAANSLKKRKKGRRLRKKKGTLNAECTASRVESNYKVSILQTLMSEARDFPH